MADRLKNKVAVISGGTSGIGRSSAIAFAAEGAKVAFIGRREKKGLEVEKQIRDAAGEAIFVKGDATVVSDLERLVKTTIDRYGHIDILMNNAGTGTFFSLHEMDVERDYEPVFELNLKSYFVLCKLVLPHMMQQRKGSIINVGSVASITGMPKQTAYGASKAAVVSFTRSVAVEYCKYNIRCNAILPGLTLTDTVQEGSDLEKTLQALVPSGKSGRPEGVAMAAVFLASDECEFMSGACIPIDGAQTCGPCSPVY